MMLFLRDKITHQTGRLLVDRFPGPVIITPLQRNMKGQTMRYRVVEDEGQFSVVAGDEVLGTFDTPMEALDYKAMLVWERDQAFNEYGSEFDIEVY